MRVYSPVAIDMDEMHKGIAVDVNKIPYIPIIFRITPKGPRKFPVS